MYVIAYLVSAALVVIGVIGYALHSRKELTDEERAVAKRLPQAD